MNYALYVSFYIKRMNLILELSWTMQIFLRQKIYKYLLDKGGAIAIIQIIIVKI